MDYEHQPTPGPGPWIGAGTLTAVGGGASIWAGASSGEPAMVAFGAVLVAAGGIGAARGIWRAAVRTRR